MIPGTLLGLVVFAASLGPGYLFVRIAERRHPRHARSQLLELAELAVVGALATTTAVLVVLSVGDWSGWIDTKRLATEGSSYLVAEPYLSLIAFLAILVVSYLTASLAALAIYRGPSSTLVRASMWHAVLSRATAENLGFVTVELIDGRVVAGYVHAYSALPDSPDKMSLALQAPLFAKTSPAAEPERLRDEYIVFRGDNISYIGVQFQAPPSESA